LGVVLDNVIVELFVAVAKRGTLSITERVLFLRRWGCTTAEIGTPIASIRTDLLEGRRKKERKEEVSRYFQGGLYILKKKCRDSEPRTVIPKGFFGESLDIWLVMASMG
jgi:hypothetical protein